MKIRLHRRRSRLLRGVALAFAVALSAAQGASARPDAGSESATGAGAASVQVYVDEIAAALEQAGVPTRRARELAQGMAEPGAFGSPVARPASHEPVTIVEGDVAPASPVRAGRDVPDGFQPQLHTGAPVSVATGSPGFDWSNLGVGLGIAIALSLLGAAMVAGARSRARVAHP